MSQFEQVDNPNPVKVPAVPEKVYDKLWITRIIIESPSPTAKTNATIVGIPWDGGANVLNTQSVKTITDLFSVASQDDDVVKAINSILKIIKKYGG